MIELGFVALLIVIGYFAGGAAEKGHFEDLKRREAALLHRLPTRSDPGPLLESGDAFLVTGNVVVASDFFKSFAGNLRSFFGGRMTTHETLMDRARREALCRMREQAVKLGAAQVVDVHINTSFVDHKGVEVSVYGTAVRS